MACASSPYVRDLDIDLIDRINPFDAAYAVLAKTMDEKILRQVQASIAAKKVSIPRKRRASWQSVPCSSRRSVVGCRTSTRRTHGRRGWPKVWPPSPATAPKPRQRRRKEAPAMADMDDDELLDAWASRSRRSRPRAARRARNASSRASRTSCASIEAHGRAPLHGEDRDIFERLYAVRLDQLRKLPEARALLAELDTPGLLSGCDATSTSTNWTRMPCWPNWELAVEPSIRTTSQCFATYVPARRYVTAEDIADRKPCEDFDKFQPLLRAGGTGAEVWRPQDPSLRSRRQHRCRKLLHPRRANGLRGRDG